MESMLYKEFLSRVGHPLNKAEERQKTARKKSKEKMKATGDIVPQSENIGTDSETENEGEEEQVMIDLALEWWQKPRAPIVT